VIVICSTVPSLKEEKRLVSSRSKAKVSVKPIDETLAIGDISCFYSPFDTVRIAVSADWKSRRHPALLP
jgi:hypothetical protein